MKYLSMKYLSMKYLSTWKLLLDTLLSLPTRITFCYGPRLQFVSKGHLTCSAFRHTAVPGTSCPLLRGNLSCTKPDTTCLHVEIQNMHTGENCHEITYEGMRAKGKAARASVHPLVAARFAIELIRAAAGSKSGVLVSANSSYQSG
jgi:hypothetical protein